MSKEDKRESVALIEKPSPKTSVIPSEITDYLKDHFAKTPNQAGRKAWLQALEATDTVVPYAAEGKKIFHRITNPKRGIYMEWVRKNLGVLKEPVFSDGYVLILDPEKVKEINDQIIAAEKAKLANWIMHSETVNQAHLQAEKELEEAIHSDKSSKYCHGWFEQIAKVAAQDPGQECRIQGYKYGRGICWSHIEVLLLTVGEKQYFVDGNRLAFVLKHFPNAKLHLNPKKDLVSFVEEEEKKAVIQCYSMLFSRVISLPSPTY